MKIVTNLKFSGQCREAFELYAKVLGGKIVKMISFGEVPGEEKLGADYQDKIMHAWLDVGDQSIMGCDAPPGTQQPLSGFTIAVHLTDENEAARVFAGLADGATVSMPFGAIGWSPGYGSLTDRFGTPWIINTTRELAAGEVRV